jgi:cell division initiation protein
MDLTPREIQEKQFHDAFRGYDHEEVDIFLDQVTQAFERVYRENQNFHHRLKQLEEDLVAARGTEDMLKRTLLTAQKTAEEAIEEANAKAQGLVVAAERRAQEMVAGAERRGQEIVSAAYAKERELQVSIEGQKKFEQEYRARLRAFIESQLTVLEEGPVATPAPATPAPVASPAETVTPAPMPVTTPTPVATPAPAEAAPEPERPKVMVHETAVGPVSRPPAEGPPAESSPPPQPGSRRPGETEQDPEDKSIKELFWGED